MILFIILIVNFIYTHRICSLVVETDNMHIGKYTLRQTLWSSRRTDEKRWRIRWVTKAEKTVRNDLYWEGDFCVENWKLIRNKPWSIALWEVERRDFRQRKKNIYPVFMMPDTNGCEDTQVRKQMFLLFLIQMCADILP